MLRVFLGFMLGVGIGALIFIFGIKSRLETDVFGEKIEPLATVAPSPTQTLSSVPSATADPTETPTPKPTLPTLSPSPAPTAVPQPTYTPSEVNNFIERFASQYSVDPNVLRHIGLCESGLNPTSVNGPYAGLFQFSANTWSNYRKKMGEDIDANLRLNVEEATQTAAYVLSLANTYVWPNCTP